jgi:hypothetical protein
MRVYGRVYSELGVPRWVEVSTAADGSNDYVYVTALVQWLKLNVGESPFYANAGIPAQQSVITQVFPDYYLMLAQAFFAPLFASLIINKIHALDRRGVPYPAYQINLTTHQGVTMALQVPV